MYVCRTNEDSPLVSLISITAFLTSPLSKADKGNNRNEENRRPAPDTCTCKISHPPLAAYHNNYIAREP